MAINLRLSDKRRDDGKSEILIRFQFGHFGSFRTGSRIFVSSERWNDKQQQLTVPRFNSPEQIEIRQTNKQIADLRQYILDSYDLLRMKGGTPTKEWLIGTVFSFHNPTPQYSIQPSSARVVEIFAEYTASKRISAHRVLTLDVVRRLLERYETHLRRKITLSDITPDLLRDFEKFQKTEYLTNKKVKPRGENTISDTMRILRSFVLWALKNGFTTYDAFKFYDMPKAVYGKPIYLTIEERDAIAELDLSARPALERQRDIFIFQCHIGCRVSDLMALTKSNIIDGAVEYIAQKTQDNNPEVLRVPLTHTARRILDKYADFEGETLFPFISAQKYNAEMKEIAKLAGITRVVTRLNPTTRKTEQVRICDIISSHMARRTFIGSAVNLIKDTRLVASLSGHAPNSKAMARYYNVEKQTKKDIIAKIDV